MADEKLTDLTAETAPADGDFLYLVDVSDTTDDPAGTSMKITLETLMQAFSRPAVYTHSGSTNISNTVDTTVAYNTEQFDPQAGYTVSAGVITIAVAGYYHVDYNIPINDDGTSGTTRGRQYAWAELNPASAGYALVPGSRSQDYAREASGGEGVSGSFIANVLNDGDLLRIQIRSSSTVDTSTESGEAGLSIHRVG